MEGFTESVGENLISLLKQVDKEVSNIESQGYVVEIQHPWQRYKSNDPQLEVYIYKPTIVSLSPRLRESVTPG